MQGTLFNLEPIPKPQKEKSKQLRTIWSYSKIGALNSCPRKFYYKYFGNKKTKAKNEVDKERLQFLEGFTNKYLITGSIVHEIIAKYLKDFQNSESKNIDFYVQTGLKKLSESIKLSENIRQGLGGNPNFWVKIIKEIYYQSISTKEFKQICENKIASDIKGFFLTPEFEYLRNGGTQKEALVEKKVNIPILDGFKAEGRIDLAFQSDAKFYIIDWKASISDYEETSLQLLGYAIWAINEYKLESNEIILQKAFLKDGKIETLESTKEHLFRAKMRIIQDSEKISQMEIYGTEGIIEAFEAKPSKSCVLCPFQEICEAKKLYYDGD
jgi:ATP-dependent exoDNAse (exonuclease V) beta subunit